MKMKLPRTFSSLATASVLMLGVAGAATAQDAADTDRTLKVDITIDGAQDWKNGIQWAKVKSSQRYEISTALRSDGKLYGANLLALDRDERLAIKSEFLRQKGQKMIAQSGLDPDSPDLQRQISSRMQKEMFDCKGDSTCMGQTSNKWAMIMAAAVEPDNSALFDHEPRYRFYFGYPGCKNTIRARNVIEAEGETGYGREVDEVQPFALKMSGDSNGTEQEQAGLCEFFTVVVDTIDDKMYVENVNIPSARGTSVRTEFGKTESRELEIPVAAPLQEFVNTNMRGPVALSGSAQDELSLNLPLDGNSTVLGHFVGTGKAAVEWSFE